MSKLVEQAKNALSVLDAISAGYLVTNDKIVSTATSLRQALNEPKPCDCASPSECNFLDRCIKSLR
jgi:hypothetical protein